LRAFLVAIVLAAFLPLAQAGAYEDFIHAVELDNARSLAGLLQRGMDPNTRDPKGQPALTRALREDSDRVVELLLQQPGLEVDALNAAGETPLMIAALQGKLAWVQRLLQRGARVDQAGWSPLLYAASGPEPQVAALLLERGAPANGRSPNGSTPLMMAARYGAQDTVPLLLARGADPRLRNEQGLTAADFARQAGRDRLAARLEQAAR
jgi:ankyrin repeat protein